MLPTRHFAGAPGPRGPTSRTATDTSWNGGKRPTFATNQQEPPTTNNNNNPFSNTEQREKLDWKDASRVAGGCRPGREPCPPPPPPPFPRSASLPTPFRDETVKPVNKLQAACRACRAYTGNGNQDVHTRHLPTALTCALNLQPAITQSDRPASVRAAPRPVLMLSKQLARTTKTTMMMTTLPIL